MDKKVLWLILLHADERLRRNRTVDRIWCSALKLDSLGHLGECSESDNNGQLLFQKIYSLGVLMVVIEQDFLKSPNWEVVLRSGKCKGHSI